MKFSNRPSWIYAHQINALTQPSSQTAIATGHNPIGQKLGAIFDEIGANLRGDTGLADYFPQLIRNRAEVASAIGTPGAGGSAATSRDLGLGQLQLQDRGTSMFQNWINEIYQTTPYDIAEIGG